MVPAAPASRPAARPEAQRSVARGGQPSRQAVADEAHRHGDRREAARVGFDGSFHPATESFAGDSQIVLAGLNQRALHLAGKPSSGCGSWTPQRLL